jgi:hypothetical protein
MPGRDACLGGVLGDCDIAGCLQNYGRLLTKVTNLSILGFGFPVGIPFLRIKGTNRLSVCRLLPGQACFGP